MKLETTQTINHDEWIKLSKLFEAKLHPAFEIYKKDLNQSGERTKHLIIIFELFEN